MSDDLNFSEPDWRGDVHPQEELSWDEEMTSWHPPEMIIQEGSIVTWKMHCDVLRYLTTQGIRRTETNYLEEMDRRVLEEVNQVCADFEARGLGYHDDEGRFIFYDDK
jgi:hypothetical protein